MFGALGGELPLRLGGTATNGWTAAQHARYCADLVALQRVGALASWSYTKSGLTVTISGYVGRNGAGSAHAPTATVNGTGDTSFSWSASQFPDDYNPNRLLPVAMRAVIARGVRNALTVVHCKAQVTTNTVRVVTHNDAEAASDQGASVTVWGTLDGSEKRAIGDYAGDPNKEDSRTEGNAPYSEFLFRELQEQRGTAYSKETGTLVEAENIALARFLSAVGPRLAEKLRANAVPGRSDERLPYWERFLAVPKRLNEPKWRTRQKLAAHYKIGEGPTVNGIRAALTDLLGSAFVDISWAQGTDLANPPAGTYWPTINPGDPTLSLGGGAWTSERCTLLVEVTRPANMSVEDFLTLMNVDFFALLDRLLPSWATFNWFLSDADGGGFILGESMLGFDAFA